MSMPPGPDPNDPQDALNVLFELFKSPARDRQWNRASLLQDGLKREEWAQEQARLRIVRASRAGSQFQFSLKSSDRKPGAHMLTQLMELWHGDTTLKGRRNRWQTIKLLRLALHADEVTSTEQIQLHSAEYDTVLATPRFQSVLEVLGISSAIENPPHLNRDWFGPPGHNWWPGSTSAAAGALELEVIEQFLAVLEWTLGLAAGGNFNDADNAPMGARGDNWRDSYSIDWSGEQLVGDGAFYDEQLVLTWHARDGLDTFTWNTNLEGTLLLETPLPLRPDFYGAPEALS